MKKLLFLLLLPLLGAGCVQNPVTQEKLGASSFQTVQPTIKNGVYLTKDKTAKSDGFYKVDSLKYADGSQGYKIYYYDTNNNIIAIVENGITTTVSVPTPTSTL